MNPLEASRDILPIWVTTYEAAKSPELKAINKKPNLEIFSERTAELLFEFSKSRDVGVAVELLNIAIIEDRKEASISAAEFLLSQESLPKSLTLLARRILGLEILTDESLLNSEISNLRRNIYNNNNNPLGWTDLARAYTIAGEQEKATKAMIIALQLSQGHRWITRAATRMFAHFDELDKAHYYLINNKNIKSDPWLLAAELAISRLSNRPLKLWSTAKKLTELKIKPIHLSELSSSLGTSELIDGANKKAKIYFKNSLIDPTLNSLAQAKWAERNSGIDLNELINPLLNSNSSAFEAKYWEFYKNKEMLEAMKFAEAWFAQEPYSSAPANAIAFTGSLINDFETVLKVTKAALTANPDNQTLKLNYIYAWIATTNFSELSASQNKIAAAHMQTLRNVLHGEDKHNAAHAIANLGMINYKLNNIELGKLYYDEAEQFFLKHKSQARLLLLLNHIREALIAEAPWAQELLQRTHTLLAESSGYETPASQFYLHQIYSFSKTTGSWKEKFSTPFNNHDNPKQSIKLHSTEIQAINRTPFWLPEDFSAHSSIRMLIAHPEHSQEPKKRGKP